MFSAAQTTRLRALSTALAARVDADLRGITLSFVPSLPVAAFACGNRIVAAAELLERDVSVLLRVVVHELVHVFQQRAGRVHATCAGDGVAWCVDATLEAEAEAGAARVAAGRRLRLRAPRRQPEIALVLQPLITVGGVVRTNLTDFSARFQATLSLSAQGADWLRWALLPTSPSFTADNEAGLITQIQCGLHGSPVALFPSNGLRLAPALLLGLPDPDFGHIVGSLLSGGLTQASLVALARQRFRTEADFARLPDAFTALGIAGQPVTKPANLADQVLLYEAFVASRDLAASPDAPSIAAAQFAAAVTQSASSFIAAFAFGRAVAQQSATDQSDALYAKLAGLWRSLAGLTFQYLQCPVVASGADNMTVLRTLDAFLRQSPVLGFHTIGEAIANCGARSGISLADPTLNPAAAAQIEAYMQSAARALRLALQPGTSGSTVETVLCQDGVSRWYSVNTPGGSAELQLGADGCLTLREFTPLSPAVA